MPQIHNEPSPLAGKTVKWTVDGQTHDYKVEDWWDRVYGDSWGNANGNPAALKYAFRTGLAINRETMEPLIPSDDEVLYGKVGAFGHLVHVSEVNED